jgi:hypothetical protein
LGFTRSQHQVLEGIITLGKSHERSSPRAATAAGGSHRVSLAAALTGNLWLIDCVHNLLFSLLTDHVAAGQQTGNNSLASMWHTMMESLRSMPGSRKGTPKQSLELPTSPFIAARPAAAGAAVLEDNAPLANNRQLPGDTSSAMVPSSKPSLNFAAVHCDELLATACHSTSAGNQSIMNTAASFGLLPALSPPLLDQVRVSLGLAGGVARGLCCKGAKPSASLQHTACT